jgi:hypothetical protein
MNIKTRLKELVKEHLQLINTPTLVEARLRLDREQWQSFWEVVAQRYIDECHAKVAGTVAINTYAPEENWRETWDVLEKLYPEYILEPAKNLPELL